MRLVVAAMFVLAAAPTVSAQPPQNAGIYGGRNHQPTQDEIIRRELEYGVTPSAWIKRTVDPKATDELSRQLLGLEPSEASRAPSTILVPP